MSKGCLGVNFRDTSNFARELMKVISLRIDKWTGCICLLMREVVRVISTRRNGSRILPHLQAGLFLARSHISWKILDTRIILVLDYGTSHEAFIEIWITIEAAMVDEIYEAKYLQTGDHKLRAVIGYWVLIAQARSASIDASEEFVWNQFITRTGRVRMKWNVQLATVARTVQLYCQNLHYLCVVMLFGCW